MITNIGMGSILEDIYTDVSNQDYAEIAADEVRDAIQLDPIAIGLAIAGMYLAYKLVWGTKRGASSVRARASSVRSRVRESRELHAEVKREVAARRAAKKSSGFKTVRGAGGKFMRVPV